MRRNKICIWDVCSFFENLDMHCMKDLPSAVPAQGFPQVFFYRDILLNQMLISHKQSE
jgi:hypothetical protein